MKLKIKRVDTSLALPTYSNENGITKGIAGFDFICREDVEIQPKEIRLIPSNTILKLPDGYLLLVTIRSGGPLHGGITLANGAGIIDPYFCGDKDEIMLQIYNMTDEPVTLHRGDKVAHGILMKYELAEWEEVDAMNEEGDGGYWAVRKNINSRKT